MSLITFFVVVDKNFHWPRGKLISFNIKFNFLVSNEQLRIEFTTIACSKLIENSIQSSVLYEFIAAKNSDTKPQYMTWKKQFRCNDAHFGSAQRFPFSSFKQTKKTHMNGIACHWSCRKSINALTFIATQHIISFLSTGTSSISMITWTHDPISMRNMDNYVVKNWVDGKKFARKNAHSNDHIVCTFNHKHMLMVFFLSVQFYQHHFNGNTIHHKVTAGNWEFDQRWPFLSSFHVEVK